MGSWDDIGRASASPLWGDVRRLRQIEIERQTIEEIASSHARAERAAHAGGTWLGVYLALTTVAFVGLAAAFAWLAWTYASVPAAEAASRAAPAAMGASSPEVDRPSCEPPPESVPSSPARSASRVEPPERAPRASAQRRAVVAAPRAPDKTDKGLDEAARTAAILRGELAATGR